MNQLKREVGVGGAILMGMGSIVGTGVFVSIGIAAGVTGPSMIAALFAAGFLAVCNGLSSAQLAAAHPVSGGTYEYGYKFLNPWFGFGAGWLFLCAKSASAATAAIGFGGYLLEVVSLENMAAWQIGLIACAVMVLICLFGIKRSNSANTVIVSVTLAALAYYIITLFGEVKVTNFKPFIQSFDGSNRSNIMSFLEACALMFVAYTGYGRIATLGEEIKDPKKNIPKAIVATLAISFILYMGTSYVSIGSVGAETFYLATIEEAAPLEVVAELTEHTVLGDIMAIAAMTAMLGVLLNLVLGLSRVLFAMGRKGDMPGLFSKVDSRHYSPIAAIIGVGIIIISLIFLKDVKATWSFSAFTVLGYYAITNLAALKLSEQDRLYSRAFSWLGLIGCLGLAFWVNQEALILGAIVIIVGVVWKLVFGRFFQKVC